VVSALAAVHGIGVDVLPTDLLDGSSHQPTGRQLVNVMQRYRVQLVRLAWGNQDATVLDGGGWKVVFQRLVAAHINAILTLHQQPPGASEGPGVANAAITDVAALIGAEETVLTQVKRQWGGTYPPNLVGLDVFNEPVLTPASAPVLRHLASEIKQFTGGIPVTIGGWRNQVATTAQEYNDPSLAGLAASIGDFVSVHLYPDNMPGGSQTSMSAAEIEPFARSFLVTTLSAMSRTRHARTPILITETGAQSGQAPGGGFHEKISGSPQHQSATIAAVFAVAKQFSEQGVRGVQVWWATPPLTETCDGSALICFDGTYVSQSLPLFARYQFPS